MQEQYISEALHTAMDENLSDVFQSSSRNQIQNKNSRENYEKDNSGSAQSHLKNSQFEPDRFELKFWKKQKVKRGGSPARRWKKDVFAGCD